MGAESAPCAVSIANDVTPVTSCQVGSVNNDNPLPGQVNADAMFGFSDWSFAEKQKWDAAWVNDDESVDIGLSLVGNGLAGTWSINNIWGNISHLMLVFKGGAGNTTPDDYVGYLIVNGAIAGTYNTPFVQTNNNAKAKNISHVTAYYRGAAQVPEPVLLSLVGLGLTSAVVRRRRKQS